MKKRKNRLGLTGKLIVGSTILLGSLFSSFAQAQEQIPDKIVSSETKDLHLKKEGTSKKTISFYDAKKISSKTIDEIPSIENSTKSTVGHPELYEHQGWKSAFLPCDRPNIQLLLGEDSLHYRGSGNAKDIDEKLTPEDSESVRNGTYTNEKNADFNLDNSVTNEDADGIDSLLSGQKVKWLYKSASEKLSEFRKRQKIDTSNHVINLPGYNCTDNSLSSLVSMRGVEDWLNSLHYDKNYGGNAIENTPFYQAVWQMPDGTWHSGGAIYLGTNSGKLEDQNILDKSQWGIVDTNQSDELETILVQPGDFNMNSTTKIRINCYLKYPEQIAENTHGPVKILEWDVVDGVVVGVTSDPYLIPFNPASSNEGFTFVDAPKGFLENYQEGILSQYVEQMDIDTAFAKSNLPTKLEKIVSEEIPLGQEYGGKYYHKAIDVSFVASTDYNAETLTVRGEVKDIEGPTGYLISDYIRRESGQSPEDAAKSLVSHEEDNSGLPSDTLVTNTSGNYYDVELKDKFQNKTYLGNVEVDWPVGTGDEPSDLERKLYTGYPNPVQDNIYVNYNTNKSEKMHVEIYGTDGRLIEMYTNDLSIGEGKETFDLSKLNQGIYLMQVTVGDKTKTTKLLKK